MGVLRARVNGTWVDVPMYASSQLTIQDVWPAGSLRESIAATAEPGWLMMDGVGHVNADTMYPMLWAIAPAAWKSGTTLTPPDMSGCVLRHHATARGTLAGANTVALALANLAAHTHTVDHNHASKATGVNSVDHTHAAGSLVTDTEPAHNHGARSPINQYLGTNSGAATTNVGSGGVTIAGSAITADAGSHAHAVTGSSAINSVDHTHSVDLDAYVGASGSTGSGTPVDVLNKGLYVGIQIKAH